jgi:streptogramin lyase
MPEVSRFHVCVKGLWLTLLVLAISATASAQFLTFGEYDLPTPNSSPGCIANGSDGALWFTERGEFANSIGRITTAGAITQYPIPTFNSGASCIRPGPDGALWFTEGTANNIGRITTAGVITEYPIPTAASVPSGIKAGPDGAMWFTEQQGNNIGRITTSGTISEYAIPTVGSFPVGIDSGPDGALWFTERSANKIGRIITTGEVTNEYTVPTQDALPFAITTGPDGALWFTESGGNQIGRITTAGAITEYPIPTTGSEPWGITSGPDGDLWFVERVGNNIASITTAGVITEYAVPVVPGSPFAITVGSDGALWVTDDAPNSIIRAAIATQRPPLVIFTSPPSATASLPGGWVGVKYAQTLSATGGVPPYTWAVTANSLPPGLSLGSTTGRITGTPTTVGIANFTVEVADSSQATATQAFELPVSLDDINQFPIPQSSGIGGITTGPDGALWFTETTFSSDPDEVGRITTAGAIAQYPIPGCECPGPLGITTGPNANLWFAQGPNIGQITTAGAATEYQVPNAIDTDGITTGPDGNLWFTDADVNYIGQITTAGVVTEFPVPAHGSGLDGIDAITAGPDGALWFTEIVGYIGRITTAGAITEFPVQAVPTAIVAGPDGALWFTDSNGAIGRITTAGVATEYPTPTAKSDPAGITVGPDGALWFTEAGAVQIGRITTSGAITEYPIPGTGIGEPGAITAGPDGALWFAENGGQSGAAIGRLLPAPTLTAINPASGAQGATVPVALTGSSFVPGGTTVNVPASITLSNLTVAGPTQATVTFTIAPNAALGPVNITVTTSAGTSQPVIFAITPLLPPPPVLTSISPAVGIEGTSVPVVVTGTNLVAGPTIVATNFFDTYNQFVPFLPGTPTLVDNGQLTVIANVYPDPTDPNSQWVDYYFQTVNSGPLASNLNSAWQIYLENIPLTVPGTFTGIQYYWTVNGTAAPQITPISGLQPVVQNLINPALGPAYGSILQAGSPLSLINVSAALNDYVAALEQGSMNPKTINGFHIAARNTGGTFGGATVSVANPGVSVSNLALVSATQINAVFNIAANAPLGPANVTVSNPAGTSAPVTFTVLPPSPTLTSISPSAGTVGRTISVTLTGSNFIAGGTTVNVTGGITVGTVTVTGTTQLSTTFSIPGTATPGQVSVTVTTAGGATSPIGFTIDSAPVITTASPLPAGTVGAPYSQGVSVSGGTPPYVWVVSDGPLPAGLSLNSACTQPTLAPTCLIVGTPITAATSKFTLVVTDASGATAPGTFALTINPAPPPAITGLKPSSGAQGTSVPVTISGTSFLPGATVQVSNPGVTVGNVVVVSASQIAATFSIAPGAALGPANVLVTTSSGPSAPAVFTVIPPPPVLTSISPSSGAPGTSVPVTLTGTSFVTGATIAIGATGITASNVTVVGANQITATFTIAANAAAGPASVTVITSGGTSGTVTFTVVSLLLTSISPAAGVPATSVPVTLVGAGFAQGAQIVAGSSSVAVSNVAVVGTTKITATFTISATATPGPVSIVVVSAGVTSAPVTFTIFPVPLTLISITPAYGEQGTSVPVTLTGTGFAVGDQISIGNSGVAASSVVVVSASQINATFLVADFAALGATPVTVNVPGGVSGPLTFTVLAPLKLTAIAPATGAQGARVPVTLTGAGFVQGVQVSVANAGVIASNVVVVSPTQITATFSIAATAVVGPANVTVALSGATSAPVIFTVTPPLTLTSISPAYGQPGTSVRVALTGTGFVAGDQVAISNSGVTVSGIVVATATEITATFTIAANAALGPANVTVTTPANASSAVTFTITSVLLSSISPANGAQGATVPVTLIGAGFAQGAQISVNNSGVTPGNIVVVSSTRITATFNIAATAAAGPAKVTVTVAGVTTGPVTFTVGPMPLTLTSISPAVGVQGATVPVTLIGTGFAAGDQIAIGNSGVTVSNVVIASATQINATLAIAATAVLGPVNVTVTSPAGPSGPVAFTVLAPLTLTSISPAAGTQGASVAVTLTGTGFAQGLSQVSVSNSGVTPGNVVVVSSTQITSTFNIGTGAALGPAKVTVTVAGITSAAVTFTINPSAATLTSISPASAPQGATAAVTLTGTNFASGATIAIANTGVTATNVVVVSATQITATFTVAAGAAVGSTAVTVSAPGGVSGPVGFTVDPALALSISGLPTAISPGQQLPFTISIPQPYPVVVTGVLTIVFTPAQSLPPDPTVALLGGTCVADTCSVSFQISESQSSASFSLQTGTSAGTFQFSISGVTVAGAPVTLSSTPTASVPAPPEPPSITSVTIQQESGGFNVVVTGLSNTREITEADFTFTPVSGKQLQTSTFSLTDVTATFQSYYASDASLAFGSEFLYTQPFNFTSGNIGTLQSVTVILKNTQGASSSVSANF